MLLDDAAVQADGRLYSYLSGSDDDDDDDVMVDGRARLRPGDWRAPAGDWQARAGDEDEDAVSSASSVRSRSASESDAAPLRRDRAVTDVYSRVNDSGLTDDCTELLLHTPHIHVTSCILRES